MRKRVTLGSIVVAAALCLIGAGLPRSAQAGEMLDRILNSMFLDVSSGEISRASCKTIVPQIPLGQTFTTGPDTVEVSRIAIAVAYWHEDWTPDKSLVLTLWDSPAKGQKVAEAEMPYSQRAWDHQVMMFTLDAQVRPATQYYFELTVWGGDGSITGVFLGSPYTGGEPYEGGKKAIDNIWFEVHSRHRFDRDAVYSRVFDYWNLDYPGLENVKTAVQGREWDAAVDALIAYYEGRTDLLPPEEIKPPVKNPDYDTTDADLVLDHRFNTGEDGIIDLGPRWNPFANFPSKGGVGFTRTGLHKIFRGAYQNTGDEMYAKAYAQFLTCFFNDLPCPLRSGVVPEGTTEINAGFENGIAGGRMTDALAIGARISFVWWFYSGFITSPNFTRDTRAAMIFNLADMVHTIALMRGGGNWEASIASSIFANSETYPEFRRSPEWFRKGLAKVWENMDDTLFPDGPSHECSFNYHGIVCNRYTGVLQRCERMDAPVDRKHQQMLERSLDFIMYSTQPDWDVPTTGDTNFFHNCRDQLMAMHDYYNRPDFLWVATKGEQGTPPLATSAAFTPSGWFAMRSGWDRDARFMFVHNGPNQGHGHPDLLEMVVNAYGSKLIIDPGIGTYGTDTARLLASTKSHATVTVDDADSTLPETGELPNAWVSTRTMDYFLGTNAGFENLDDIRHTRAVIFVKPDYWVIHDSVSGSGEHTVASRFPFFPGPVEMDAATGVCRTLNPGGNLMIASLGDNQLTGSLYDYPAAVHGTTPAKGAAYTATAALPLGFSTVLYPYKGRRMPRVTQSRIGDSAFRISATPGTDYVCFGDASSEEVAFAGEAMALRTGAQGVSSLDWVNGTSATWRGMSLASCDRPIGQLEVIYEDGVATIVTDRPEPSLRIASLGVTRYRVGCGEQKQVRGPVIQPYAQ